MIKSIYKSALYSCTNKRIIAKLLSNKAEKIVVKTCEIRNPDYHFLNKKKTFYKSKITGERFSKKPDDYSPSRYREFSDASRRHKKILKNLNFYLSELPTPRYLFSKKESDYKKNALFHIGNTKFILLDIKSFFPNCRFDIIRNFFIKESGFNMCKKRNVNGVDEFETDVADSLARLVTAPIDFDINKRFVPQGYPTSTLICFFAYKEMFDEIDNLAKNYSLKFSTYVDDLTFSYSNVKINEMEFVNRVIEIVEKYHHTINKKKVKIIDIEKIVGPNKEKHLPCVTGLIVKRNKVRASTNMHKKMNTLFNKLNSFGRIKNRDDYIKKWELYVSLTGIYNTINYIEPTHTQKNRLNVKKVLDKNKKNFLFHISINRIKQLKMQQQIYDAYRTGTLNEFAKKHKDKLVEKK